MWLVGPANDRTFNSSDKMVANNFTGHFSDEGQTASSPISRLDIWNNDNNSSMDFLETVQLLMSTGQGKTLENSTVLDTPDLEQTYATTHLQVGLDISSTKSSYMSTSPCDVFLSFAIFNDTSLPIVCNNRTNITSSDYEGYISATDQENNWFILMLLPLVIFGAAGNLLVCLAISMEKRLQNITNYFLLSLAVTDLLVSIIVMPLSIIHEFHGYWPLGLGLCDFFVTSDVLMCTSSIMHLCTISLERYLAIRFPLRTRNKSKQIVILKIGLVWAISIAISSPITVLGFVNPINILSNRHCVLTNDHFVIYGSILAFFIPLVIMIIMYTLTIHILYKQSHMCGSKNGRKGSHPLVRRSTSNRYRNKEAATRSKSLPVTRKSMEKRGHRAQHCGREENGKFRAIFRKSQSSLDKPLSHTSETVPLKIENAQDSPQFEDSTTTTPEISSQGQEDEPPRLLLLLKKHNLAIRAANLLLLKKDELPRANNVQTEQRASKVLGIVFAIFVVCWAPFFCVNIMTALCKSCSFDPTLITVFVWLGYVSSTLNPIIYTVFNRVFKVTFWKLLCCRYNQLGRSRSPNKRKTTLKSKYHSVRCQPSFGFSANDTQTLHTQNDTVF